MSVPSPPSPRRAEWVFRLAVAEVVVTLATAVLVTLGGPSDAVSCPSFPSCLSSQTTVVAAIHQAAAGVLLVVAIVIALLALPLRARRPRVLLPAALGLGLLLVTAVFGMLFASGALPLSVAPIQFGFLSAVVLCFGWTAYGAHRAFTPVPAR